MSSHEHAHYCRHFSFQKKRTWRVTGKQLAFFRGRETTSFFFRNRDYISHIILMVYIPTLTKTSLKNMKITTTSLQASLGGSCRRRPGQSRRSWPSSRRRNTEFERHPERHIGNTDAHFTRWTCRPNKMTKGHRIAGEPDVRRHIRGLPQIAGLGYTPEGKETTRWGGI
jgi:hypothetical protein